MLKLFPEVLNRDKKGDVVFVCDHASNHVPEELNDLGLTQGVLDDHIALDIGAGDLTRRISALMSAPAILAPVSRLVIDTNRGADHAGLIPVTSDDVIIPGNRGLSTKQIQDRIEAYYNPFHTAVSGILDGHQEDGLNPFLVGLHSFTPQLNGGGPEEKRPWHIGLMWDEDPRLAQAMIGLLERETDLVIGHNQPYSGHELFHTTKVHGERRGLPAMVVEIRQDLLVSESHIEEWAVLLANLLDECLNRGDLAATRPVEKSAKKRAPKKTLLH